MTDSQCEQGAADCVGQIIAEHRNVALATRQPWRRTRCSFERRRKPQVGGDNWKVYFLMYGANSIGRGQNNPQRTDRTRLFDAGDEGRTCRKAHDGDEHVQPTLFMNQSVALECD
jgi:hypothetical protein